MEPDHLMEADRKAAKLDRGWQFMKGRVCRLITNPADPHQLLYKWLAATG
ncbi:MAG: hypothetical protein K2W78_05715 [Xanthobacteraceae bacterium]|nr:hypothetical protein [Xanthobacteraceae bacterium]